MELAQKVEAILFAIGDRISVEEIVKLTRSNAQDVTKALQEVQKIYADRAGPLSVFDEGEMWKLTVKESFLPLVRKIVSRTELAKSVMETLAVLAWKAPMKQSELIEIRSNKGYDHISDLEKMGFITREPHGRTYMVKLTQKFFDYFELSGQKDVEKKFGKFKDSMLIPQKHISEFEQKSQEEIEAEEKQKIAEQEQKHVEFQESYAKQKEDDKDFLSDIEGRIDQVGQQSNTTKQVFDDAKSAMMQDEEGQQNFQDAADRVLQQEQNQDEESPENQSESESENDLEEAQDSVENQLQSDASKKEKNE